MYIKYLAYKDIKLTEKKTVLNQVKAPTPTDIEVPFYKPDAPFDNKLYLPYAYTAYPIIILTGRVFNIYGDLLPGAVLDWWQADPKGEYDMNGFNFRGKIKADAQANYELRTVEPGDYQIGTNEYRCAHIHVKVSCDGYKLLTTQLYFYGDKYNPTDHWFNPSMIITQPDGFFDFVLEKV
jgi:protocatechuate 3,4-dioxygenase beta subunit